MFRGFPIMPRWVLALVLALAAALAAQSVRLGHQVLQQLEGLSTAATDNMQWNLSQAEVEHLKLETAVLTAQRPDDLPKLRRQFDIYYSRIATFRESPLFEGLRRSPAGAALLQQMTGRLERMAAAVDSSDQSLIASLPDLAAELQQNSGDVRELALFGVVLQVADSKDKRLKLFSILARLGWVVLALVLALALATLLLGRLYRKGRQLAMDRSRAAARMEAMIASSLDAILVVGADGRIQAFNGAAETVFGYKSEEAIGQPMVNLIVPDHLQEAHKVGMQRFLQTGEARVAGKGRLQMEARRKSGELFPVELSVSVSQSGTDIVFVSFLRDISDRIAAEKQLRRARDEALAGEQAKQNLLTVMSHEMRTPLTGVLGAIELIENTGPTPEQRRYLQAMRVSGELLLHHVNDVLELSRLESGAASEKLRIFDLEELVGSLVESQQASAQGRGIDLSLHCSLNGKKIVAGRPRAVQQVLLNLIGNALKFTGEGAVSVDVMRLPDGKTVEFHVADTGQGIAPEDLERIFEDFIMLDASYGRGSEGTGLGLSITKRLVRAMGGTISCESELGEGSLFSISLPLPAAKAPPPRAEKDRPKQNGACRLLIAEDNDINRELLATMLRQEGHQVTAVPGGREAVQAAGEGVFDLILMDISMPQVDGIEALRRIRAQKLADGTDIVALTAHAAAEDHARILEAGFAEVLTKPANKAGLADVIARRAGGGGKALPRAESDIQQFFDALGQEKARVFLQAFCKEVKQLQEELGDCAALEEDHRKEAHRLAGSAAVLGLPDLRAAMLAIETANEDAEPPLAPFLQAWANAEAVLAPHLQP
ncbi:hybrid sensor histidine kinase/response regulator [Leisingera sp. ANG-Vp]|uniref:hybrid sensor histidine kinase/response regulator n=1 Tax=Leisingera sp. ANG-Vp TaxID=1577896 RepID=UPI00057EC5CB|nr:PAS domain-containing hybrid sensor histidine kinase/response regulator [Leisingera sp. ANG-Vp]KIC20710.1 histidine kinase [Leisingera sp. ANG-Vp]